MLSACLLMTYVENIKAWATTDGRSSSTASRLLLIYGSLMAVALLATYVWSLSDLRTLRDVGIWAKPMKFMAATALFAWTTVWLAAIASTTVSHGEPFKWIAGMIIASSLFEVAYISYQAAQGSESHYNTSDALHALLFGIMALAAFGLTASQAWLALEIWRGSGTTPRSAVTLGAVIGLVLTFALATVSGFLLGGNQPPPGPGLPVTGWHMPGDLRPAHFLGVHAQQLIPLLGLLAERTLGGYASLGLMATSALYVIAWVAMTWFGLSG
jgi:hypothetical protein